MRQINDDVVDCDFVSLNELSEISNEIKREVRKIIKKHEKTHKTKPMGFIQVFIRQTKEGQQNNLKVSRE